MAHRGLILIIRLLFSKIELAEFVECLRNASYLRHNGSKDFSSWVYKYTLELLETLDIIKELEGIQYRC
jgi:hypothetical protein